jgi:hypothetical protein
MYEIVKVYFLVKHVPLLLMLLLLYSVRARSYPSFLLKLIARLD